MEQKDKDRINKFVGIWNPDDMDGMLIAVLVMSIIFPFLAYCFCFNYKINTFKSAWVIFFICYGILIIWNIYIRINIYKNQIQFFLFSGIANGVIATEFLAFFYYQGRYKLGINPGYLVLSQLGVVLLVAVVIYYGIRVLKGLSKNRSGSPNYSIIVGVTLGLGIVGRGFLSGVSKNFEDAHLYCLFYW